MIMIRIRTKRGDGPLDARSSVSAGLGCTVTPWRFVQRGTSPKRPFV